MKPTDKRKVIEATYIKGINYTHSKELEAGREKLLGVTDFYNVNENSHIQIDYDGNKKVYWTGLVEKVDKEKDSITYILI